MKNKVVTRVQLYVYSLTIWKVLSVQWQCFFQSIEATLQRDHSIVAPNNAVTTICRVVCLYQHSSSSKQHKTSRTIFEVRTCRVPTTKSGTSSVPPLEVCGTAAPNETLVTGPAARSSNHACADTVNNHYSYIRIEIR
jgi:hypothetical protein